MDTNTKKLAQGALKMAIAKAGGTNELARKLGITHSAVSQWVICPPQRVLDIESISGVSRHDLRPDFYPRGSDQ